VFIFFISYVQHKEKHILYGLNISAGHIVNLLGFVQSLIDVNNMSTRRYSSYMPVNQTCQSNTQSDLLKKYSDGRPLLFIEYATNAAQ